MSRILVTNENLDAVFFELECHGIFAIDTETTGLEPYKDHCIFSVIVSTYKDDFYFNFNQNAPAEYVLPDRVMRRFRNIIDNPDNIIYMHNAKFDMHFFNVEDVPFQFKAKIVCTQALARIVHNQLPSYSLENLAADIGFEKDNTVMKYILKNKLYTDVEVGKKKPRRDLHYDKVPFEIMSEYGMTDGHITFKLGTYLNAKIMEMNEEHLAEGLPSIMGVVENEIALTKTLFKMEAKGVRIDWAYCKEAYAYERSMYLEAASKFYAFTDGIEFEDSAACYKQAFKKLGLTPGRTGLGRDSYSADNLPDNDLTDIILQYRKHYKRAHTYFGNFLELADDNDIIHCSFNQAGTATGRLSSSHPNLQNVPKRGEDGSKYPVRKAFIPREGMHFYMVDWDQMEYRLLLDLADEREVIRKIKDEGLDVHTATAESMGVERDPAKTLNFMLLYGGGAAKLATALKTTVHQARNLKNKYFSTLRKVQRIVEAIKSVSKTRGYIVNYLGRRLNMTPNGDYKMPNHFIQGSCGDIAKEAMNEIHKNGVNMLMTVHDEVILEMPEDWNPTWIKKIMETTYKENYLPLTAGVDHSPTDWFNKEPYHG